MRITENIAEFGNAVLDTTYGAVCVKKRGKDLTELCKDEYGHGVLVSPTILCGMIHGPEDLADRLKFIHQSIVTVRGHGWDCEKRFVWTGTVEEFNKTWVVD